MFVKKCNQQNDLAFSESFMLQNLWKFGYFALQFPLNPKSILTIQKYQKGETLNVNKSVNQSEKAVRADGQHRNRAVSIRFQKLAPE